jgi:hypothetical protein
MVEGKSAFQEKQNGESDGNGGGETGDDGKESGDGIVFVFDDGHG